MSEAAAHTDFSQSMVSDNLLDFTCQICSEDNKSLDAVGFCVDCSEYLCDTCYKSHLIPRPMRHHKLIGIDEAKNDPSLPGCLDLCTEKCPEHDGESVTYFCLEHDCLGCGVCITLNHRKCKQVQYIPKVAQNVESGEELTKLLGQLDMISLQATLICKAAKVNILKSQVTTDNVLEHVRQIRKDINASFDKLENDIEEERKNHTESDEQAMTENAKNCEEVQVKAISLASYMRGLKHKGRYCNVFVAMKANRKNVDGLAQSLQNIAKSNSVKEYVFQLSDQVQGFTDSQGILGNLVSVEVVNMKGSTQTDITIRMENDDNTCMVSGIAAIARNQLAATDSNNKKVKLIDTAHGTVMSELPLPCRPCDVTSTERSGVIAVTLPDRQEVLLLSVSDGQLTQGSAIKTSGICYGISSVKDKLVVSLTEPERLEIIDYDGNVLQRIENDGKGQQLFTKVISLAVNQSTGTIYAPDMVKHTVTGISLSGAVVGVYKDRGLREGRGVSIDNNGVVYVCGLESKTIHQLTPDCRKISSLLSNQHGLSTPISVCYDRHSNSLYVGQIKNAITVYPLSSMGRCN